MQALWALRTDYTENVIMDCVDFFKQRGALDGKPCFSPMGYLKVAMAEVLSVVEKGAAKDQLRRVTEQRELERKQEEQKRAEEDAAAFAQIQDAFQNKFPGEQQAADAIAELIRLNKIPFRGEVGKNMALRAWWAQVSKSHETGIRGEIA